LITGVGYINGTLLGVGTGVTVARILADAFLALWLRLGSLSSHSIGTAEIAALIFIALTATGRDFVDHFVVDGFCEELQV